MKLNPLDWFRKSKPALRNKPGGMAWIRGLRNVTGEHVLNGRAVKTLGLNQHGLWSIDPPQDYRATSNAHYQINDTFVWEGGRVSVLSIGDQHLEPWKEDGVTDSEVRDLYEPTRTPEAA